MSKYIKVKKYDIANGYGVRHSIWFAGCTKKCKGCFSMSTWDFNQGRDDWDSMYEDLKTLIDDNISGISILGGDPLEKKNIDRCLWICKKFKNDFPLKSIWLWTGENYEDIKHLDVIKYIDVLIDGRFVEELKDYDLDYKGSSNQRLIKINKEAKT